MSTLGEMKEHGHGIILYCENIVGLRWCLHSQTPNIDQLIQYFGVDYEISAHRAEFLARFVCEACGGRLATVRLTLGRGVLGVDKGQGHSSAAAYVSIEEATRRHHAFEAEQKRLGIKSNAEMNAESNARRKAQKRAEKAGTDFIGPPNPWAHRKRGRWL
ncbi:hypothetical protein [Devosia lacusdianchii]|uniref:hypothetical protein n=1 Tax=Devosia lacusdianchii TaxID=2917991 RepID=UPI001F05E438|nr:hypothetical protein [Devosia sp. JXJ CY 41]